LADINFPALLHERENGFLEIRYDFSLAVQQAVENVNTNTRNTNQQQLLGVKRTAVE
jgi:hypothetical protein